MNLTKGLYRYVGGVNLQKVIAELDRKVPGWWKSIDFQEDRDLNILGETHRDLSGKAYNDLQDRFREVLIIESEQYGPAISQTIYGENTLD